MLTPWRFVFAFGMVSLLADLVYEGARAVTGPFLASLGASALLVGVVTGLGEAFAFAGRLGTGPLADRTRAYWPLTIAGYALTVAAVPLLGFASALWLAAGLVIAERAGKAIRSPAKDVLLSHAAAAVGRGRGFAVHEALDQIGALLGPLLVAAALLVSGGDYRPAFWVLAVPGVAALVLLVRLRARMPDPHRYELEPAPEKSTVDKTADDPAGGAVDDPAGDPVDGHAGDPVGNPVDTVDDGTARLPRVFWGYVAFTVLTTIGFATFGVLSFHLADRNVVPVATIPVIYAAAMIVDAAAAVATGWLYDRIGGRSLVAVPVLAAAIPPLAFHTSAGLAISGVLLWGAVLGIQESTMRAAVADLVPVRRRGTAYGIFAAGFGGAVLAGSTLIGALYTYSLPATIVVVVAIQVAALLLFLLLQRRWSARPESAAAVGS